MMTGDSGKPRFRFPDWRQSHYTAPAVALFVSLLLFFGLVADLLARGWLFQLDSQMLSFAAEATGPAFTQILLALTRLGGRAGIAVTVVLIALYLCYGRQWRYLLTLALAYGGGEIILSLLKVIYQRSRPETSLVGAGGYSFPSGHALAVMLIYGFLAYLIWHSAMGRKVKLLIFALLILLGLGVGASRIYLQAHWLTDVLGGYLAGFAWLMISLMAARALGRKSWNGDHRPRKPEVDAT